MKCLSAVSAVVVTAAFPLASRGRLEASVIVVLFRTPGLGTKYTVSVIVTAPVGVMPEVPVLVAATEKVSDCPVTTLRTSGVEEASAMPTPLRLPIADSVPPLSVNTWPSGPMMVGT